MKTLIYFLIFTLSSGNLFAQSYPYLKFRKPTTSDGGTTWRFKSVTSGIDAYISIVGAKNATLNQIDDSTNYADAWNPFIRYTSTPASNFDSSYLNFKIVFRNSTDNSPVTLPKMAMTIIDCDGGVNGINIFREMVITTLPATPKGFLGTLLSTFVDPTWLGNVSGIINYSTLDTSNYLAMSQLNYTNVASYNLKVGVLGRIAGGATRQASFYFKSFAPLNIVLPVKIVDFKAKAENNANILTWSTTSEENANKFEVYRSLDGKDYYYAGTVKSVGYSQSSTKYAFVDQDIAGIRGNVYYKLRVVDNDGQYSMSPIAQVRNTMEATKVLGSVFPNPTQGVLNISFESVSGSEFTIQVVDMFGKTILSYQNPDLNEDHILSLDLNELSNGIYLIKVSNSEGSIFSEEFIKS